MSDYQDRYLNSTKSSASCNKLYIGFFSLQQQFSQTLIELLNSDRYEVKCFDLSDELIQFVTKNKEKIDCILLVNNAGINSILKQLWRSEVLLPTVIVEAEQLAATKIEAQQNSSKHLIDIAAIETIYHQAEIHIYPTQLKEINHYINLAITKFLNLSADSEISCRLKNELEIESVSNSLVNKQRHLTEKIAERLGCLGVYYKRNRNDFYSNLSSQARQNLYEKLSFSYREILLKYFNENTQIDKKIDEFVHQAFFADISTSQILEIHMELIDDFSCQLRIEGRNEDLLLDYRLPLIDVVAHLCEMYRRSIPGENVSWELLFKVE